MKKTAFAGGLMIDGTGAPPIQDSLLLVEGKNIVYAGEKCEIPADYEIIDIGGKTIIPGIIDAHLHFSGNLTENDTDWVMEDNLQKAVVAVQQSHECLEAGLTTVGEISRFGIHIRNMVEAGVMSGPRIVATGLGFCATAGHGDSHCVSVAMNKDSHPWAECVDSPWDLRKAVRRRLRENPDAIKIWATGGGIWRWDVGADPHYSEEEIQAVVDECKLRNIPVWSHCFGEALPSVKAGADFIIHGWELSEETLDIMADKGLMLCPTIAFLPAWFATYPPKYIPEVHDKYEGATTTEKELNRMYETLRKAADKGIILTIGSDSFNSRITPYGITTLEEMYAFVQKVGISELETIKAATLNGAKALRVDDVTGSLEAGKSADLLVINGNPLDDITAISVDNMNIIMKEGCIIKNQ
ncbi:MAG: amidohydrolase family protein [Clostridia bacterium]|nr:amidohydrolase family protein [Clostridia bacterium]